jgi:hypothetical protein
MYDGDILSNRAQADLFASGAVHKAFRQLTGAVVEFRLEAENFDALGADNVQDRSGPKGRMYLNRRELKTAHGELVVACRQDLGLEIERDAGLEIE